MPAKALSVYLGREAAARIAEQGWHPDHFDLLMGASGGPKWFILSGLDQTLFGDFLARGSQPLTTLGSSIGSWRHACLPQSDPAAAIRRLEAGYLYQEYSSAKPSAKEISQVSTGILDSVLEKDGLAEIIAHPRYSSHVVTARGLGLAARQGGPSLIAGMGMAAVRNAMSREQLHRHFQRVVFYSGETLQPALDFHDFDTLHVPMAEENIRSALHASGSIPFVLTGEQDIPGAPRGQYWDGGIIDYHFDLHQYHRDGLLLYPHFRADITPGWFDKFLPWRKRALAAYDKLVLLCPNPAFVAELPLGKIPDRSDFTRLSPEERVANWETCVTRSHALADEFNLLMTGSDPLAGVTVLD